MGPSTSPHRGRSGDPAASTLPVSAEGAAGLGGDPHGPLHSHSHSALPSEWQPQQTDERTVAGAGTTLLQRGEDGHSVLGATGTASQGPARASGARVCEAPPAGEGSLAARSPPPRPRARQDAGLPQAKASVHSHLVTKCW